MRPFVLLAVISVSFWGHFRFRPATVATSGGRVARADREEGELISW